MADIFISYARPDRERIEKLANILLAEGYSVWWDHQIKPGSEFSKDIERELDAAKAVVVAWSESASESHWVKDEAAAARDESKLVPLSLDRNPAPLGFRQYQAIDFSTWKGKPDAQVINELLTAVKALVAGTTEPHSPFGPVDSPEKPGRSAGKWISLLVVAVVVGYLAFQAWQGSSGSESAAERVMAGDDKKLDREMSETERSAREAGISEEPWIAVAPIKVLAGDAELSNLAEALTEGITSGLSRFSYLLVTSQSPVSTDTPVTKNVRYLLEGTLREAGSTVRFAFQLIDSSGARVWDATFDRDLGEISALEVQDDLTDRVVASVADPYGGLIRDLTSSIKLKTPEEMTAYEAVLRQIVYRQRIGESDHLLTRQALERAVELEPGNADAWAALALIINEEYKHDYNRLPETQARALAAARKALELEPGNAFANHALAEVYFFLQDVGAFRAAAERAISLNPRDSDSMAMIGIMMGYAGDWDRSVELTTRALELNPNHPGWYRFSLFFNAYRLGDYQKALDIAQRINMPEYFADSYARAIAHAQLGHEVAAQAALDEFLALWPGDMENFTSVHLERWFYAQPELVEQVMEGLRKAGLEESGQP